MSGHAGQLTLDDRLNIVVRNLSDPNSYIRISKNEKQRTECFPSTESSLRV